MPALRGPADAGVAGMDEISIERTYHFCPRCGTKQAEVGQLPFRCEACGFANFFGPVAAVGAMVTNADGELLLVRRAKNPGKGRWGLPGGFVDGQETAEQAVAREVREETDLQVIATRFLMTHPNRYNYGGVVAPVIDLFFRCEVQPGKIRLLDGELDHFIWTHPGEEHLSRMAFESNRIAIEYWMQRRRDR